MRRFVVCCLIVTFMGCISVKKALDNYEACAGDPVCIDEMQRVKDVTYIATETGVSMARLPSVPSVCAMLVSGCAGFLFGALRGKRKGKLCPSIGVQR